MKLFLASYRFGAHVDEFLSLTSGPGRIAVIANASDSWPEAARESALTSEMRGLSRLGFDPFELDLRKFTGHPRELAGRLDSVSTVWIRGGNTFVLRSQLHRSGADDAISTRVRAGALVYAGYSAGACVASVSLRGVEFADDPAEVLPTTGAEPSWDGIGLVDVALIPHFGSVLDEGDAGQSMKKMYEHEHMPFLTLTDDEVFIVDGDRAEKI